MAKIVFSIEGQQHTVFVEEKDNTYRISNHEQEFEAVYNPKLSDFTATYATPSANASINVASPSRNGGIAVKSPMSGVVKSIDVATGDTVERNQVVAHLEAMKMEVEVLADRSGTVSQIVVEGNAPVSENDPLLFLS